MTLVAVNLNRRETRFPS